MLAAVLHGVLDAFYVSYYEKCNSCIDCVGVMQFHGGMTEESSTYTLWGMLTHLDLHNVRKIDSYDASNWGSSQFTINTSRIKGHADWIANKHPMSTMCNCFYNMKNTKKDSADLQFLHK